MHQIEKWIQIRICISMKMFWICHTGTGTYLFKSAFSDLNSWTVDNSISALHSAMAKKSVGGRNQIMQDIKVGTDHSLNVQKELLDTGITFMNVSNLKSLCIRLCLSACILIIVDSRCYKMYILNIITNNKTCQQDKVFAVHIEQREHIMPLSELLLQTHLCFLIL